MITAPTNKTSSARVNAIVLSFTIGVLSNSSLTLLQCNIGTVDEMRIAMLAWLPRVSRNPMKRIIIIRLVVTGITWL